MDITDVNTIFGAYPSQHPDSNPDALVATMESHGVSYGLTLSTYGLYHDVALGNDETMHACQEHDRLIPVATINPMYYWGDAQSIVQVANDAFEMFRFFPHVQGWPLDFAPFTEVLDALAGLARMPIMVDVAAPGDTTQLARQVNFFPHAVVLSGVSEKTLAEAIVAMRANERIFVETHALRGPSSLALLRDQVGIGRILFGSGAPGMSLNSSLRYIRQSNLTGPQQDAVFGGNAQQIWHSEEG